MPVTSSSVGTTSITWWNCQRVPPLSLIFAGHEIAMPWGVPPKKDEICFVDLYGVSRAQAHPIAKWAEVCGVPHQGYHGIYPSAVNSMPLNGMTSFGVPVG